MHIAVDHDGGAFFQEGDHFIELFAPDGDTPPDGDFFVVFASAGAAGYFERSYFFAACCEAHFRISAEVTSDMDKVHISSQIISLQSLSQNRPFRGRG